MSFKNAIGGVAFIAATAVGAAILALPVSTAHLGFTQTVLFFLICWFFMTMGALYILEANLVIGYGTNLISMAEKTLGNLGKYFTWTIYLILLYALVAVHLAGASVWINQGLSYFQFSLLDSICALIISLILVAIILLGTHIVDWINRLLMIGLISAFLTLLFSTSIHVQIDLLFSQNAVFDLRPIPLIVTAFGSAIIIPSLTEYLHGNARQLVWVVLLGSLVPLAVYLSWEWAIVGTLPETGEWGLLYIQQHGHPVTDVPKALEQLLHNTWITTASSYFAIFALTASFLGLCIALFDFLADGLNIKKNLSGKLILASVAFFPPLAFLFFYPKGFIIILSFAGLFVALLLGILPVLMVWQSRYKLKLVSPLHIIGGKILLVTTMIFFLGVIAIEIFNQWEVLTK